MRTLIYRKRCNIFSIKQDLSAGNFIGRVAGDGIAKCGFAGSVRPHQYMGLIFSYSKIYAVKNLFVFHAYTQTLDFKQTCVLHIECPLFCFFCLFHFR